MCVCFLLYFLNLQLSKLNEREVENNCKEFFHRVRKTAAGVYFFRNLTKKLRLKMLKQVDRVVENYLTIIHRSGSKYPSLS